MQWQDVQIDPARPHHPQVIERVRHMITSGELKPGQKLPPTDELARSLGTHVPTVHAAMRQLVREGLVVRQRQRGTFVRQRDDKLTCVAVLDGVPVQEAVYSPALHRALKEVLKEADIEVDLWLDPRPEEQVGEPWMPFLHAAANREFQAVIVSGTDLPHLRWQMKLPLPTAIHGVERLPGSVTFDLKEFFSLSLRALAEQRCRTVGLIIPNATRTPEGQPSHAETWAHFLDLSRSLGLTIKDAWMRLPAHTGAMRGRSHEGFGYEEFRKLWSQPERPEGLVVYEDVVARGVILAMQQQQVRAPHDVKLVFHKNESIDLLCPMPATLIVSSERAVARALLAQVQKQFRGESAEPIIVPFRRIDHSGSCQ